MGEASVTIARDELLKALKSISKFIKPKKFPEALISFKDNLLIIEAGGVDVEVPAEGNWTGQARIQSSALITISKQMPTDDPISIRVEANRLYISRFATLCIWKEKAIRNIVLPMDAPITMILSLALKYSQEEIENSGLMASLKLAEEKRDRLIDRALDVLQPLDLDYSDLKSAIDLSLKQKELL